jgi:hypothetical protein
MARYGNWSLVNKGATFATECSPRTVWRRSDEMLSSETPSFWRTSMHTVRLCTDWHLGCEENTSIPLYIRI